MCTHLVMAVWCCYTVDCLVLFLKKFPLTGVYALIFNFMHNFEDATVNSIVCVSFGIANILDAVFQFNMWMLHEFITNTFTLLRWQPNNPSTWWSIFFPLCKHIVFASLFLIDRIHVHTYVLSKLTWGKLYNKRWCVCD